MQKIDKTFEVCLRLQPNYQQSSLPTLSQAPSGRGCVEPVQPWFSRRITFITDGQAASDSTANTSRRKHCSIFSVGKCVVSTILNIHSLRYVNPILCAITLQPMSWWQCCLGVAIFQKRQGCGLYHLRNERLLTYHYLLYSHSQGRKIGHRQPGPRRPQCLLKIPLECGPGRRGNYLIEHSIYC